MTSKTTKKLLLHSVNKRVKRQQKSSWLKKQAGDFGIFPLQLSYLQYF
jgi:hypothetical protein